MNELILKALAQAIKEYPEIKPMLKGNALLMANVFSYKIGEAPDDDVRRKDEELLEQQFVIFFEGQIQRIIKHLKIEYKVFQSSFWDDEFIELWNVFGEYFTAIIMHAVDGGLSLLVGTGLSQTINRDVINTRIIDILRRYRDNWLYLIEDTSRKFIQAKVSEWLQSGRPLQSLINSLLEDTSSMFNEVRARRIAVTEVTRLYAMGNQIAWEQAGYIDKYRWNTANDELVCEICGPKAGQEYPLVTLSQDMPAHVNCRCWSTPIVSLELFESEIGRILNGGG